MTEKNFIKYIIKLTKKDKIKWSIDPRIDSAIAFSSDELKFYEQEFKKYFEYGDLKLYLSDSDDKLYNAIINQFEKRRKSKMKTELEIIKKEIQEKLNKVIGG